MESSTEVAVSEITAVAVKLESSPDLTTRERAVLALVFSLAGEAAAEHPDEVTGFMPTAVENRFLGPQPLTTLHLPATVGADASFAAAFLAALGDGSVRPGTTVATTPT